MCQVKIDGIAKSTLNKVECVEVSNNAALSAPYGTLRKYWQLSQYLLL